MSESTSSPQGEGKSDEHAVESPHSGPLAHPSSSRLSNPPTPNEHNKPDDRPGDLPWWRKSEQRGFVIQVLLLAVGIYVAKIYSSQLSQMTESNRISREALSSVQRAFVTTKTPLMFPVSNQGKPVAWGFQHQFENSGATPTINAIQNCTELYQASELPTGFTFPDGIDLKTMKPPSSKKSSIVIGPKATASPEPFYLPADLMEMVKNHTLHLYLWGWVRYRDIFMNTPTHVTEFCFEVKYITVQDASSPVPYFGYCDEHNCTDETCKDYREILKR